MKDKYQAHTSAGAPLSAASRRPVMKLIVTTVLLIATSAGAGSPASWTHVKGGIWDPDETALTNLRADIQAYVTAEAAREDAKLPSWDEYRFQYQGRLERDKRIIFVNAFCHTFDDEQLEKQFLEVFDGGPCYFTLEYDPSRRTFRALRFNGYA
jgi:hypothetical protein